MTDLRNKPVVLLLRRLALVLTILTAGAACAAAADGPQGPQFGTDSASPADPQPTRPVDENRPGTGSEDQYWVVSTRRCPQENDGPLACPIDYFQRRLDGRVRRFDEASFLQSFQPGVPICVVVHGSFVSWDGLWSHSRPLYRWIRGAEPDRPLQVVFVSWPSDGPLSYFLPLDIAVLGRRSAFNGFYLAQLASKFPETSPITFVGHSHGARLISSAIHLMGGGSVQGYRAAPSIVAARHQVRAVLFAAAMDHDWLNPGERYGRMLYRSNAVLSLRNREDIALGFYPLRKFNSNAALARVGLTNFDRQRLGSLNPKLMELDVTAVIGSGHVWQHYFSRPEISQVIAPYVFFTDRDPVPNVAQPGQTRPLYQQHYVGHPAARPQRKLRQVLPVGGE